MKNSTAMAVTAVARAVMVGGGLVWLVGVSALVVGIRRPGSAEGLRWLTWGVAGVLAVGVGAVVALCVDSEGRVRKPRRATPNRHRKNGERQ